MTIVRPLEARPRGASLLIATLLVGLTVAFRLALLGQDPERPTFILFMLPVLASAHLGGWLGGASATALAAVAVDPLGATRRSLARQRLRRGAVVRLSRRRALGERPRRGLPRHASALRGARADLAMITAQKSVETSARESDARYRAILDQAAVGIALVEPTRARCARSTRGSATWWATRATRCSRCAGRTHRPDDVGADESSVRAITRPARHGASEKRYVHKDSCEVWVSVAVSPLEAPDEEATLQVAVAVNISERKRADRAARAQRVAEEQLARVVASVPGLLCSFEVRDDGTVSVSYASPGALDLLGCTAEEFLARRLGVARAREPRRPRGAPRGPHGVRARRVAVARPVSVSARDEGPAVDRGVGGPARGGRRAHGVVRLPRRRDRAPRRAGGAPRERRALQGAHREVVRHARGLR